jgi:hypothetical protein
LLGAAIWVHGVVLQSSSGDRGSPNVSFTLDGIESPIHTVETSDEDDISYNVTMFQASNLANEEHKLCIQTHNNASFLVSTYAAK